MTNIGRRGFSDPRVFGLAFSLVPNSVSDSIQFRGKSGICRHPER